jgi:hypothetical protein
MRLSCCRQAEVSTCLSTARSAKTFRFRLPLRIAIELLSARVAQLSQHMTSNGLQPPPMPPGKSAALGEVFASLGLQNALRDSLVESADTLSATDPATRLMDSDITALHQSPIEFPAAPLTVDAHDSFRQEERHECESFGNDLQLWSSCGNAEIPHHTSGLENTSPHILDISPHQKVFGASADTMSSTQSRVNYEGPSIFDADDASQSNGSNESLVDELSHRVGVLTIGPEGRTKLRGPSLIFNVEKAKDSRSPVSNFEFLAHSRSTQTGRGPNVPDELQDHLVGQYFDWENLFYDIVDREIYILAKARHDQGQATPYFSQALCSAM